MRKFFLTACLAAGLVFAGFGNGQAQAQYGHQRPGCNTGHYGNYGGYYGGQRGFYGAGYSPYGRYYAAPVATGFYPVGVYGVSRVGVVPSYGFGYNNIPAARFGGAYGNLGYPNTVGPRAVLRIGF